MGLLWNWWRCCFDLVWWITLNLLDWFLFPLQIGHKMSNAPVTLGSFSWATVHQRSQWKHAFRMQILQGKWSLSQFASTMVLPKSCWWHPFFVLFMNWIHGLNSSTTFFLKDLYMQYYLGTPYTTVTSIKSSLGSKWSLAIEHIVVGLVLYASQYLNQNIFHNPVFGFYAAMQSIYHVFTFTHELVHQCPLRSGQMTKSMPQVWQRCWIPFGGCAVPTRTSQIQAITFSIAWVAPMHLLSLFEKHILFQSVCFST